MSNQTKYIFIAVLLVVVGFGGYALYQKIEYNRNIVRETDPGLTDEQRKDLEGDIAEADEGLRKSENANDDRYELYLKKAKALQKLGKLGEAEKVYYEAKELFPNNAGVYRDLAELQIEMNNVKAAQKSIEKYVEINPDSSGRWERLIDFHYDVLKSSEKTLDGIYQDALSSTNNNVEIVIKYARFLEEIGDNEAAKEKWIQAGSLDPEDKASYDAEIKRLEEKMNSQQ